VKATGLIPGLSQIRATGVRTRQVAGVPPTGPPAAAILSKRSTNSAASMPLEPGRDAGGTSGAAPKRASPACDTAKIDGFG